MENKASRAIKDYLAREGRKSSWLAEKVGVAPVSMSRYLNGRSAPIQAVRINLSRIIGVDVLQDEMWGM